MKKFIITIILSLLCASPVLGFDLSGKWVSTHDYDDYQGQLEIKKSGKSFKVQNVSFSRQETPTFSSGCGVYDGKTVNKGNELEVYDESKLGFIIRQNDNSVKVIPHLSVDDPICMGGHVPEWVHSKKGIEDMSKGISNMKWKKVKKFSWE